MPKGRPAVAGEARTKSVEIRLTSAERESIDRRAAQLGKSVSNYARDLLLADAMAGKSPVKKRERYRRTD